MKAKMILMSVVVAVLLSLVACSSVAEQAEVSVDIDDFMEQKHISKEVEVAVDGSLTVTLGSNPTTGFKWSESAEISDQTVLQQTDHEFIAPEGEGDEPPATGTSGREVWTFKALKKGTTEVSMEYSRPWEGGEKAEWTFVLTVIVK
jgi:inhibitor of cysteine peptidase